MKNAKIINTAASVFAALVENRGPCPDCGGTGPHQDNGEPRGAHFAMSCSDCGCFFEPSTTLASSWDAGADDASR